LASSRASCRRHAPPAGERAARDLARIRDIIAKYADLPADFADASLVALAERRGLFAVTSVDSDFTVYRGATRRRFRNVFFE
jgi:predicted nucleic acid-binding protein